MSRGISVIGPGRVEWVDPLDVRFTQAEVSPVFSDGTWLPVTYFQILSGQIRVGDVPLICCYWHQGRRFSIDNRRLAVWRALRLRGSVRQVPVFQVGEAHTLPCSFFQKLDTVCDGRWVLIRGVNMIVGLRSMFFLPSACHARHVVLA